MDETDTEGGGTSPAERQARKNSRKRRRLFTDEDSDDLGTPLAGRRTREAPTKPKGAHQMTAKVTSLMTTTINRMTMLGSAWTIRSTGSISARQSSMELTTTGLIRNAPTGQSPTIS
ncbi:MAG: hypothetical protein M1840_008350 [Geoglossum simile]|nr:MAG: hypothetical protein M1840_008350 [Geoglossum simile]